MCTAISFKTKDFYFGRTLDLEYSYIEAVTVVPRNFSFDFRWRNRIGKGYAIIGMAYINEGYPLFYDAVNEKGLAVAGLNFPGNAYYFKPKSGKNNIASYEFIPYILRQCSNVSEAENLIEKINITDDAFSKMLPPTPLHWIIADKNKAITIEQTKEGLKIYENTVGVLTNNPPFDFHMTNLANYMNLTANVPENRFSNKITLLPYSRGMGAVGLPGDVSSASRFVRTAFTKLNSVSGDSEEESVSQFFHILSTAEQVTGTVYIGKGKYERTVYTSCCNADKGIYYYTTYENRGINAVAMHNENLNGDRLISYVLDKKMSIKRIN